MSTPTTARGALLRRAGTLLVAAALVGAPATSALADPTGTPSPTVTASPSPSTTEPTEPSPTTSTSTAPAPTTTAPTTTAPAPTASAPASTSPSPAQNPTPDAGNDPTLVPGGKVASFGPAAAEGPATSTDPTQVAADYLERELVTSGNTLPIVFDGVEYPQYGLVADAVLALDAAGTGQDAAASATTYLTQHVVDYVGFGDPKEIAAGSVAKLLNVAIAQGVDPSAFGGFDLIATLQGLQQQNGRFSDVSTYGDNSNTFGQSFALIGLHRAGETVPAASRTYLLTQQCPGGGFQLYLSDSGCSDDAMADPDATSMAVQALLAVGGGSAEAGRGLDYLAAHQASSGGVGGGGPNSGVNANSTGLAGQAFLAGGRTTQAQSAVAYLSGLQYGCDFPVSLRGGIAYDRAAYEAQSDAGANAEPQDQDRRSTSQALLALAATPLASVTAEGATAAAPSLTCAAAPSTTTPGEGSPTTSAPTGDPTTGSGAGTSAPTGTAAAAPTGSLAQTGTDLLLPVGLGLALVVVGAATLALSRRRGAHS